MAPLLWHYTVGVRFAEIERDGVLVPATTGIPDGERVACWFTSSTRIPYTARKMDARGDVMTLSQMYERGGGVVRIGVAPETAPLTWASWASSSGCAPAMVGKLRTYAERHGDRVKDWRATFDDVPRVAWLAVEWWRPGDVWTPRAEKGGA